MPENFRWMYNRNVRSSYWQHYHEGYDFQKKKPMIQCRYCGDLQGHPLLVGSDKTKSKPSTGGVTTGMGRHYNICKKAPKHHGRVGSGMDKFVTTSLSKQATTKDQVLDKALNFFLSRNIAFNQADNPYVRALMSKIRVDGAVVVVNRDNIRKRLSEQAERSQEDLMSTLMSN
jgi:hypothetical protein